MPVPLTAAAAAFEGPAGSGNHRLPSFDHATDNDDDGDVEWNLGELVGDEEAFLNSLPDQEEGEEDSAAAAESYGDSSTCTSSHHSLHLINQAGNDGLSSPTLRGSTLSSSDNVQSRITTRPTGGTMNDSTLTSASGASNGDTVANAGAASSSLPSQLTKGPSRRAAAKKKKQKASGSMLKMGLPKRPLSSYNLFFAAERVRIYEHASATDQRVSFEELGKIIGKRWKALSDEDRKIYDQQADKEVQRYREERKKYEEARRERIRNGGRYDFAAVLNQPKIEVAATSTKKAPPSAAAFFPGSRGGNGPSHPLPPGSLVASGGSSDEPYRAANAYDGGGYAVDESGSFRYGGRRDAHGDDAAFHGGDLMLPPQRRFVQNPASDGRMFYPPSSSMVPPPPQHAMRPPPPHHPPMQHPQQPIYLSSFRDTDEEHSDDDDGRAPNRCFYPAASSVAATHSSLRPHPPPYSLPPPPPPPSFPPSRQRGYDCDMPEAGSEVTALDERGNLVTYRIQYACYRMKRREADEYMSQFQQYLAMNQQHHPHQHQHHPPPAHRGGVGGGGSTDPPSLSSSTSSSLGI